MKQNRRKWRGGPLRRAAALFLGGCLAAAGFFAWRQYHAPPSPADTVSGLLRALQKGDVDRADGFANAPLGFQSGNARATALYRELFGAMRYVIADAAVTDDRAQVTISVTIADMESLLAGASYQMLTRSLAGDASDDAAFYQLLAEALQSGRAPPATHTVPVFLLWEEETWRVDVAASDAFLAAISGGIGPF